ncbi:MAG: hypothetical protein V7L12_22680 [Nostoc sp.]
MDSHAVVHLVVGQRWNVSASGDHPLGDESSNRQLSPLFERTKLS